MKSPTQDMHLVENILSGSMSTFVVLLVAITTSDQKIQARPANDQFAFLELLILFNCILLFLDYG